MFAVRRCGQHVHDECTRHRSTLATSSAPSRQTKRCSMHGAWACREGALPRRTPQGSALKLAGQTVTALASRLHFGASQLRHFESTDRTHNSTAPVFRISLPRVPRAQTARLRWLQLPHAAHKGHAAGSRLSSTRLWDSMQVLLAGPSSNARRRGASKVCTTDLASRRSLRSKHSSCV